MIHARPDYARFQDPAVDDPSLLLEGATAIAEDEPVFLLRGKDRHFLAMLKTYLQCIAYEDEITAERYNEMKGLIEAHIERAVEWQAMHGVKSPDVLFK